MTTITIQRNILLNMIADQIKTLEAADHMNSATITLLKYLRKLRDDCKTAGLIAPVSDDIIQDYDSGTSLETRQDKLIDEIEATGVRITEELFNHVHDKP